MEKERLHAKESNIDTIFNAPLPIVCGHIASGTATFTVTVLNVAPVVTLPGGAVIDEGGTYTQSGSFSDPGVLDTWTATVDYGDGSGAQSPCPPPKVWPVVEDSPAASLARTSLR